MRIPCLGSHGPLEIAGYALIAAFGLCVTSVVLMVGDAVETPLNAPNITVAAQ